MEHKIILYNQLSFKNVWKYLILLSQQNIFRALDKIIMLHAGWCVITQ